MKWVVLGDIGWPDFYHLGDDAMAEVAAEQLQQRGATRVTLVSARSGVAEQLYNCPDVPRIGFSRGWGIAGCQERLDALDIELRGNAEPEPGSLRAAISSADFALIAGGGNLTSDYFWHIYERVAFARIARHTGTPLFVTSQTVGPVLHEDHAALVAEIADISVCFGAREARTAELMRALTADPGKVVETLDDATLMEAREEDSAAAAELRTSACIEAGTRPILASFTDTPGASGLEQHEYVSRVAELLDGLAERHDAPVLLIPHSGDFHAFRADSDQGFNQAVIAASHTGRVSTPDRLPTAREQTALMEGALFSVSSRYHPLVFAARAGTPAVGVALSGYSTVRMRGALAHAGLERWVVPSCSWARIAEACDEAINRGPDIRSHLRATGSAGVAAQAAWWDALVDGAAAGAWNRPDDGVAPPPFHPHGEWSVAVEASTPVFEQWTEQRARRAWAEERAEAALADAAQWRERALRSENRKIARVIDRAARVLRK